MLRRLISLCVLLALAFQATAPAYAYAHEETSAPHCAMHELVDDDCSCCADESTAPGGCATLCSALIASISLPMSLPRLTRDEYSRTEPTCRAGPSYLPLTPPPIA